MSTKHTPGPWSVDDEQGGHWIETLENDVISRVCKVARSREAFEANARLIAAAPEQNELLQTFTEWARQVAAREDVPRGIRSAAAGLADDGRRLIAKATGSAA